VIFLQQVVHQLLVGVLALGPAQPAGASAVLHDWDDRRAAAWAACDPTSLGSLYVTGSAAGRADVAMLRAWRERGLRVHGMRMQLLGLRVRHVTATRLELDVTDRLTGAVARGPGVRLRLPEGEASVRRVVLVRTGGSWRVAQAIAVRTTSPTVRSRKR
jgi:hypothetical protein